MPCMGMPPRSRYRSRVAPAGAGPVALTPYGRPVAASWIMMKPSPPTPDIAGSTTPTAAAAAIAASIALPPSCMMRTPAWEASG